MARIVLAPSSTLRLTMGRTWRQPTEAWSVPGSFRSVFGKYIGETVRVFR